MPKKTTELILTAGPSISYREVEYVTDAVLNGWNNQHSEYIKKFEKTFSNYIGVKYAVATSSCTGALHLALLAMGVGPGDEVILPETTWIATASAVVYTGAKPVFADIEPDTWVMDTSKVEKLITPRTKVIIPVHLYGHPVDMDRINEIAKARGIRVLEDAAPSIGAKFNGMLTGSLGEAAAFSFQGAKALVAGEGGLFVTNSDELHDRVRFLNDHGRDQNKAFRNIEIGYKYKLSNIQAALGLAQVERAEELVAKKRQIFSWYKDRLEDIDGLQLNVERPWARNIFWMSSIVLDKNLKISRDECIAMLKEQNIDSRPFFYPISSFPMFDSLMDKNPVAYDVPLRGINLPSGHERTEEEIDYICAHIRSILGATPGKKVSQAQPHGWLEYRDRSMETLRTYKNSTRETIASYCVDITNGSETIGTLEPLNFETLQDADVISTLSKWRDAAQVWFPTQFRVTFEGTKRWLENNVLNTKDRILFMVNDLQGKSVGHVGLFRFNYLQKYCEIDNIVRGEHGVMPGAMLYACSALHDWAFDKLDIESLYLRVVSDNTRALKLYEKLGYREINRVPLQKIEDGQDSVKWIDAIGLPYLEVERYSVTMKLSRAEWKRRRQS